MRLALALTVVAAACGSKQPAPATPDPGKPTAEAPPRAEPPSKPSREAAEWIAKLDDPRQTEQAVTELEQLGDPAAIKPLGEAWLAQGRSVRLLQVMIALARPLTPDQAKAQFVVAYETAGRGESWAAAAPYLVRAVAEIDEASPRSVDSAFKAAGALGEARLRSDVLADLAGKPVTKRSIAAQIAAIRALGAFDGDAKAARALVDLLARDAPPRPSSTDIEKRREREESYGLYLAVTGATINALGELRSAGAAGAIVLAMYRTPELFMQARRALVAIGGLAKAELQKALRHKSVEVDKLFDARRLDQYCGDDGQQPCQPVSARDFYPAVVLGDFYDAAVVPDLLAALARPPTPVYYIDDQPAPTTQHNAVFDALRKIGAPDAAQAVRGIALGTTKADPMTRVLAVATYPFVTRDTTGLAELAKIAGDNTADDELRQEAATALARLSSDPKDIAILQALAKRYIDASAKKAKEAAPLEKGVAAADKAFADAKAAVEKARNTTLKVVHDQNSSVDAIKAATVAAKTAEDNFRVAKKKHKDKVTPFKQLDSAAKAYLGYARMFQTHIARVEIAARCKADAGCFANSLTGTPEAAAASVKPYIKDVDGWTADEKRALVAAAVDRAMLELGKLGPKASSHTGALLDAAKSDDRVIRTAVLLALPKIATAPCASCVTKLDEAIRAGEGKATLGDLDLETAIVKSYFRPAP